MLYFIIYTGYIVFLLFWYFSVAAVMQKFLHCETKDFLFLLLSSSNKVHCDIDI